MKTWLLLQMEDRKERLLSKFLQYNKQICTENNIKYVFLEKSRFHVPPYWQKIFELEQCMKNNPTIEYIMWLDSDAFLYKFSVLKMQDFLEKHQDSSMIITRDMPPWSSQFNAGAFIVKNNTIGRTMINEWIATYNPNNWTYHNSKWTTESKWAGEDYEQGAFVKYILPKYRKHIAKVYYYFLNNHLCNLNTTISVHLAGYYKRHNSKVNKCKRTFTRKRFKKKL